MPDDTFDTAGADAFAQSLETLDRRTTSLTASANGFARAMGSAFAQSTVGGRALDEVLKGLALRVSSMAVSAALQPLTQGLIGGLDKLVFSASGGSTTPMTAGKVGTTQMFASGGVIGTPSYFAMPAGGVGVAGEAGPEAILPLSRGADGRLGVASSGGNAANVTINISTPDADSFRRSETWLTGQIARAVARGQRSL